MKKKLMKLFMLLALCLFVCGSVASAKSAAVASIGGKKYSSLEKALKAVKNGQTIKLQKNITTNKAIVAKRNVKFTLDLNKHKIKAKKITYTDSSKATGILRLKKGTVTLKNGTIRGSIRVDKQAKLTIKGGNYMQLMNYGTTVINKATFKEDVGGSALLNHSTGKLTIKNVNASSVINVIWMDGGTVQIKNGAFQSLSDNNYPAVWMSGGALTVNGGQFKSGNTNTLAVTGGTAIITNGSFSNNVPQPGNVPPTVYVGKGSLTISGGNFSANMSEVVYVSEGLCKVTGGSFTGNVDVFSNGKSGRMIIENVGAHTPTGWSNIKIQTKGNWIGNGGGEITVDGKTSHFIGILY